MPELIVAATAEDYLGARRLLWEYGASIGWTVCAEGIEEEYNAMESTYGPPTGRFLLLRIGTSCVGCVGLRDSGSDGLELKCLYVHPAYRGRGWGRRLVEAAISMAQEMVSPAVKLHTLPATVAARHLYLSMVFVSTD